MRNTKPDGDKLFDGLSIRTLLYDKWVDLVKDDGMFPEEETSEWYITQENAQDLLDALDLGDYINKNQISLFINDNAVYNGQKASYDLIINKIMEYLVDVRKVELLQLYIVQFEIPANRIVKFLQKLKANFNERRDELHQCGIDATIMPEIDFAISKINEQSLFKTTQHQIVRMTSQIETGIAALYKNAL